MVKHSKHLMPFIKNKKVFSAVSFARKLIRDGELSPGLAVYKASRYYNVSQSETAKYLGTFANNVKLMRVHKEEEKENFDDLEDADAWVDK